MAEPTGPGTDKGAKGAPSARPRAQTLDLPATEVRDKTGSSDKPEAAASAKVDPKAATKPTESPKPATEAPPKTDSTPPRSASTSAIPPTPAREGFGLLGVIGAALLGAALAVLAVSLFHEHLIPRPQPDMSRVAAVESRLEALGREIAAARKLAEANDPKGLAGRIDALDGKVGGFDGRIGGVGKSVETAGGRIAALEGETKLIRDKIENPKQDPAIGVLTGRVEGLEFRIQNLPSIDALEVMATRVENAERRAAGAADREDVTRLANRIAGVNEKVEPLDNRVTSLAAALRGLPKGDPAARLVVAIGALDQALAEGRPFTAELATAKTAAGDGAELKALDPYAASGIATRAALSQELAAIIAKLTPLKAAPKGSILERFVANAGGVLTITPQDGGDGTDASAVRAKLTSLAAAGDVEQALAYRGKLDEAGRAATDDWATRASARVAADTAVNSVRAAALARLAAND